jgi:hypothetical protein
MPDNSENALEASKTLSENVSTGTIKKLMPIETADNKTLELVKMNSKASRKT